MATAENLQPSAATAVLRPLYSYPDADFLAGVSRGTSRRWLRGYSYQDTRGQRVTLPPVTLSADDSGEVTFLDLVEIVAIGRLKEIGFALPTIRQVVRNCREILSVERPLATLKFKAGGREIFVERPSGVLLEVGRKKGLQAWDEVLGPFLANLDYADELASRWWPLGHDKPIVVDPDYGFGFPVVAKSGVRTEIIRERFQAGDLREQIARDFSLDPIAVERALQFELDRAA